MFIELRNQARHAETIRSNATNFALLIASALIALITVDKEVTRADGWLCVIVALVGFLAAVYSLAYTERYVRNKSRARRIRNDLDSTIFAGRRPSLSQLLDESGSASSGPRVRLLQWIRRASGGTHAFWLGLPLMVFVLGCLLALRAFAS
jgi:hypothetical protein